MYVSFLMLRIWLDRYNFARYKIVTMTNWLPDLTQGDGPLYLRLADRIESDIGEGVLEPGIKLPPQRDLAFDIGVTVGTVGRAYALLRERGLVTGEVGRGTYVIDRSEPEVPAVADSGDIRPTTGMDGTRFLDPPSGKLRLDNTAAPEVGQGDTIGTFLSQIVRENGAEVSAYARRYPDSWFEAGAQWLARGKFRPSAEDIVPSLGAHAAIVSVISAMTSPGDHIVFEHVTYSQISRSAGLLGRRTVLARSDENGLIPEDFEHVCAQRHPKLAFLMPSAQNPTLSTMSAKRRYQIADIARRYNVWLIEDDLYGSLARDTNPLLAECAPDRTFLVNGLSKSVAAGIRGGWVACPAHTAQRVRVAHKMITGGMSFLLAELCARLVLSGEAAQFREKSIAENNARLELVRKAFSGHDFRIRPNIPFVWLALPEPWLSGTFKKAAFEEGVLIDDEDEFKAGRSDQVFHRARIGISAPRTRKELASGLATLRRLLDGGRAGYDSFG